MPVKDPEGVGVWGGPTKVRQKPDKLEFVSICEAIFFKVHRKDGS